MYEYELVRIGLSFWSKKPKADYHLLIEEHAQQGGRLVQILGGGWPPMAR